MASVTANSLVPALCSPSSSSSNDSFYSVLSDEPLVSRYQDGHSISIKKHSDSISFPSLEHKTHLLLDNSSTGIPSTTLLNTPLNLGEQSAALPTSSTRYLPPSGNLSFLAYSPPPLQRARQIHRSISSHILSAHVKQWKRRRNKSLPSLPSPPFVRLSSAGSSPRTSETDVPEESSVINITRTVKFQPSENYDKAGNGKFDIAPSPHPRYHCRPISTDTLASLAWTGHSSASTSPSLHPNSSNTASFLLPLPGSPASPGNETSSLSAAVLSDSTNPPVPQISRPRHRRRWTLATAMTDSRITDEVLIEGLEKVRMAEQMWEWRDWQSPTSPVPHIPDLPTRSSIDNTLSNNDSSSSDEEERLTMKRRSKPKYPIRSTSDPSSAQTWQMARRALLICRELVRTERNYLASLHILASGGTITPPPPIMLKLLAPLIEASSDMLKKMERNPSALGVAEAFVSCETGLNAAFVSWCTSVGDFFAPSRDGKDELSSQQKFSSLGDVTGPLKRKLSAWRKNKTSSSDVGLSEKMVQGKTKLASIRDLAILPTQRVSRYVLLYKDLLRFTPQASPSYVWVQSAVWTASRMAQNCDAAQSNAMFLR